MLNKMKAAASNAADSTQKAAKKHQLDFQITANRDKITNLYAKNAAIV
jgi:hypothetical protein